MILAKNITDFSNLAILLYQMIHSKYISLKFNVLALYEWKTFLSVAIPIGSLITMEWICYELFTIQAGRLS